VDGDRGQKEKLEKGQKERTAQKIEGQEEGQGRREKERVCVYVLGGKGDKRGGRRNKHEERIRLGGRKKGRGRTVQNGGLAVEPTERPTKTEKPVESTPLC
jgi:hypothetical protein